MLSLSKAIERWIKPKESQDALGLYLASDSISMVHLKYDDKSDLPQILANRHIVCSSDKEKQEAIKQLILDQGLNEPPCYMALPFQEYKTTLLDMPPVNESELASSVRWMLKDVINYPADEACVDVFEVPLPRAKDNMQLIYTAVIPFNRITYFEKMIKESGGQLASLGIPEFALRDFFCCLNLLQSQTLVIYLGEDLIGKLIIMDKKAIYMLRNIDLKDNLEESFVLEIQRYLDYSNTLFRKQICEQAFFLPGKHTSKLSELFKAHFEIKLQTFEEASAKIAWLNENRPLFQNQNESEIMMALGAGFHRQVKGQLYVD